MRRPGGEFTTTRIRQQWKAGTPASMEQTKWILDTIKDLRAHLRNCENQYRPLKYGQVWPTGGTPDDGA